MNKIFKGFLLVLGIWWMASSSLAHADTRCSSTLKGDIKDNVIISKGSDCVLDAATVYGNVIVSTGASLTVSAYDEPSTIRGSVLAEHCNFARLEGNVTVNGDVQIEQCTGNTVNGFKGPGIQIGGNFSCNLNSAGCQAWLGNVGRDLQLTRNRSALASDVSLTKVGGILLCSGNAPEPTHTFGPDWVGSNAASQCGHANGFIAHGTSITTADGSSGSERTCGDLANLASNSFPVPNTQIISSVDVAATATLPEHCLIEGAVNRHVSPVDGCSYADEFEIRLPLRASWNGRFMFQGGGGTEGAIPPATGTAGTLTPTLAHGYAVASQDGGHENTVLLTCGTQNTNEFYLDPESVVDNSGQSIQVSALMAKFLIAQYYGRGPDRSYFVGCSAGGRQGMTMSQVYPQYFDGIVAGDPVYDVQAVNLSEIWGMQQIVDVYQSTVPKLPALATVPGPAPQAAEPLVYPAFPKSDQALLETALLQACDALDGVTDGVIDNVSACQARFDPAQARYTSGGKSVPLQCPGAKDASCLSRAQVTAIEHINEGPRDARGRAVYAPSGAYVDNPVDNQVFGYMYDGGYMSNGGIDARKIGTATTPPGDYSAGVTQFPYLWISPPKPDFDVLNFDFNRDLKLLVTSSPESTNSTSLDIKEFVRRGGKIIWYHGASDPGPPISGTIKYYTEMAAQHGGLEQAQQFSRLYPVPGMCHCSGGPATDQFDMLTPLVQWVEHDQAPSSVIASGTHFTPAVYGITTVPGPATRSRPLCPYPEQARYIGGRGGLPDSLGVAKNFRCVKPDDNQI